MKSRLVIAATAALLVFTGACKGDSGKTTTAGDTSGASSSKAEPQTEAALRDAARKHFDALKDDDAKEMFSRLSNACQQKHGVGGWAAEMKLGESAFESFLGIKLADTEVGEIVITNFTPTGADVSVNILSDGKPVMGDDADESPEHWIYEDGSWRDTECESFGEDSGGDDGSDGDVSAATAQGWPAKWCSVNPGDAKEAVRAAMGEPTYAGDEQDQWEAYNLDFTAFYDSHGVAYQLQTDTSSWSSADKANLTCDEVRKLNPDE